MSTEAQKIREIINSQSRGADIPKRIFIAREQFDRFAQEMEPIYKEQYGGFIVEAKAFEEGYMNVMFDGVAVCLDDGWRTPSVAD